MSSEAEVQKVLAEFKDPETGRSVVQTQQVRDVQLAGEKLSLTLALTSHSAPIKNEIRDRLSELLRRRIPSLYDVEIKLAGSSTLREQVENGVAPKDIAGSWRDDEAAFRKARQPFLMY